LKRSVLVAALLLAACATPGEPDDEDSSSFDFLLHSDLPLWLDYQDQTMSPRHFADDDSLGCLSDLPFGDWKLTYQANDQGYQPDTTWWRVTNYGVIHCGAFFQTGDSRGANDEGIRPGFAIDLGVASDTGLALWVWEIGLRPGSHYLLLGKPKEGDGSYFVVLDPDCSAGEIRKADFMLSSWRTEYCNVPSQDAMRAIALAAAVRPAIGRLDYIGEAQELD